MQTNKKMLIGGATVALAVAGLATVLAASKFAPDAQPVGYVGQPVVSSSNVASGTARMYTIDYDASNWSGNLHSYVVSAAGAIGTVDDWTGGASAQVLLQSAAKTRYIVTKNRSGSLGMPFVWSKLSTGAGGQQTALDPASAAAAASSSPVLDYIRGDAANEGNGAGQYRVRPNGLGDMIHSTPVYWNDGTSRTIFVGANDGMLHAISAADGKERFAYIPSMLIPKLAALANQSYAHQYFVDGRLDIKKFGTQAILTGTLGAGGKGLFGLDVTNAAATSEDDAATKVLWEVSNLSSNFGDLGDTYAAPTLLTLPDGNDTPALVVGNGYNNTGTGRAVLYLINARTGALIKAFDTGSGNAASPNGLSSPSLWDADGDGRKDTAYAGDIDGNLWKFSLVAPYTVSSVKSLFSNPAPGDAHAITMAPGLVAHPLGGVMVTFVTGRMLTAADAKDTAVHYAYGIWDGAPAANTVLLEQTLAETSYSGSTPATRVRIGTTNMPNWTPGSGHHRGWRTELPIGGERVVGDGAFVTGSVFQFLSTNPTVNTSAVPPGENWWMQLNVLTGGDTGATQFDLNNDRKFTSEDQVNARDPVGRYMGGGVRSQLIAISADGVDVFQSNYDKNGAPLAPPTTTETTTEVTGDRGVSGGHFDTDIFCYTNCGSGGQANTINGPNGAYTDGDDAGSATAGLKYVHVHEYDDIFDVTGINMLAPSQPLQKLAAVKYGNPTTTTSAVPANTAYLKSIKDYPPNVIVVSTSTSKAITSSQQPAAKTYVASDGTSSTVAGYPQTTSDATGVITTTKTKVTTTVTSVEAINLVKEYNSKKKEWTYTYDKQTTVRKWDTVTTTVVTVPVLKFKVLMANQAYSPAVKFSVDGVEVNAYEFQATSGLRAASLPTYQLGAPGDANAIKSLVLEMPLDAFNLKDWSNTGKTRAGLHPTRPQCLGVISGGKAGPAGEWRNGALTVQIVDPSVTDNDLQPNVASDPKLGYRLKTASMKTKLIAEYLIYWHHPNQKCMGDSGWTMAPPQDPGPSTARSGAKGAGSDDPIGGLFGPGSGSGGGGGSGSGSGTPLTPGTTTTTVVDPTNNTRTTTTVVIKANASGGYTITTTVTVESLVESSGVDTGGAVGPNGGINLGGIDKNAASLGRITWRELQK